MSLSRSHVCLFLVKITFRFKNDRMLNDILLWCVKLNSHFALTFGIDNRVTSYEPVSGGKQIEQMDELYVSLFSVFASFEMGFHR